MDRVLFSLEGSMELIEELLIGSLSEKHGHMCDARYTEEKGEMDG